MEKLTEILNLREELEFWKNEAHCNRLAFEAQRKKRDAAESLAETLKELLRAAETDAREYKKEFQFYFGEYMKLKNASAGTQGETPAAPPRAENDFVAPADGRDD